MGGNEAGRGMDGLEHANSDSWADEKVSESVDESKREIVNGWMDDFECEGTDGFGMKGNKVRCR